MEGLLWALAGAAVLGGGFLLVHFLLNRGAGAAVPPAPRHGKAEWERPSASVWKESRDRKSGRQPPPAP